MTTVFKIPLLLGEATVAREGEPLEASPLSDAVLTVTTSKTGVAFCAGFSTSVYSYTEIRLLGGGSLEAGLSVLVFDTDPAEWFRSGGWRPHQAEIVRHCAEDGGHQWVEGDFYCARCHDIKPSPKKEAR